jgi:hypothetical protein
LTTKFKEYLIAATGTGSEFLKEVDANDIYLKKGYRCLKTGRERITGTKKKKSW